MGALLPLCRRYHPRFLGASGLHHVLEDRFVEKALGERGHQHSKEGKVGRVAFATRKKATQGG